MSIWQAIRALRAVPTGAASHDRDRRLTFVASLRQAEELAEAARAADYAARPLPLFYSLSQAGRAIAAARLRDSWKLHGHGLSVKLGEKSPLLETAIRPSAGTYDSFSGMAAAIGSPRLEGDVTLGALWAANPDLRDVSIPAAAGRWPRAVEIPLGVQAIDFWAEPSDPHQHQVTTDGTVCVSVDLPGATGEEISKVLDLYPTLRGSFGIKQGPMGSEPAGPDEVVVRSPDQKGILRGIIGRTAPRQMSMAEFWSRQREFASIVEVDEHQPRYPSPHLVGFALPEIANAPCPAPLLLWWALLLGLSSLARYEPATWVGAIDLDTSELAVSLERVLDIAEERVPMRILEGLKGN